MKTSGLSTAVLVMSIAFPGVAMSAGSGGSGEKEESEPQRPIMEVLPGARRLPGHEEMLENMRAHLETLDEQENRVRDARRRQNNEGEGTSNRRETTADSDNPQPSSEDRNARERQAMRDALDALPSDVLAGASGNDNRDVILRVVCGETEGTRSSLEESGALSEVRNVLCPPD